MRRRTLFIFALFACAFPSGPAHALTSYLFLDLFERAEVGADYKIARAKDGAFTIKDGVLIGKQTDDDHGAVIRKELDFDDIEFHLNFRFNGGSRFNFVIDDKDEKSVHAGHICRVSLSPKRLMISDDKTGAMNLKVRAQRQSKDLPAAEAKALKKLLAETQATAPVDLEKGRWYTLRVTITGDVMSATIDGKQIAKLCSPGIAHPTKTKFGMTVNGATIDFDDLKASGFPTLETETKP